MARRRRANYEIKMFLFLAGRQSRDGHVLFPRHAVSGDWALQQWTSLMCKNMAKEVRMKKMNLVPIMALQSSATVANGHVSDKWHDPETEAGTRLEAWDDLTGLSLDPRGVLEARQKELDYIEKKKV